MALAVRVGAHGHVRPQPPLFDGCIYLLKLFKAELILEFVSVWDGLKIEFSLVQAGLIIAPNLHLYLCICGLLLVLVFY